MYVPVSNDDKEFYSQGFVVRFFKSDGSDWVANFELGLGGLSGVYDLPDKPNTFVVFANGTCYFMTPENTKPIKTIKGGFQQLFFSDSHQIILLDFIDVTIIETDGQHWNSERISWDGFKDIKLIGDNLSGLSYDPMDKSNEWIVFVFNIKTKQITGGSYRRYEFTPVSENVESIKRKTGAVKTW